MADIPLVPRAAALPGSLLGGNNIQPPHQRVRLELARLLFADFDPAVVHIASQLFLLVASVGGQTRRHVPDFLLHTTNGTLTVVDVKPAARLADAKVTEVLAWAEEAVTARGWRFEVWSEPPRALLGNIRSRRDSLVGGSGLAKSPLGIW